MDSNLYQDVVDLDVLSQARRNARALSIASRIGDETATMVNAARLRRALVHANTTLGKTNSLRDLTRAADGLVGTIFVRCDLRDTQWVGRRLHNVMLSECKLHGVRGRPKLEGLTFVEPDLSPEGDGSFIGTADEARALWENPPPILCSKAPAKVGNHGLLGSGAFAPENGPDGTDLGVLMALSSALPGVRQ